MKEKVLGRSALFLCFFVGIGAFVTAPIMMLDPSGKTMMMDSILPFMQVLPCADLFFSDFLVAGDLLFIINGLCQLICAGLLLRGHSLDNSALLLCGFMLMVWTGIQFFVLPLNPATTLYFILGFLEILTASALGFKKRNIRKEDVSC